MPRRDADGALCGRGAGRCRRPTGGICSRIPTFARGLNGSSISGRVSIGSFFRAPRRRIRFRPIDPRFADILDRAEYA